MDVPCYAASTGQSTESKHHMEESNSMSREETSKMVSCTFLYSFLALHYQFGG